MWVVEINIAGLRFTHEVHARRSVFRLRPRRPGWRLAHAQHPHAA